MGPSPRSADSRTVCVSGFRVMRVQTFLLLTLQLYIYRNVNFPISREFTLQSAGNRVGQNCPVFRVIGIPGSQAPEKLKRYDF
jgi:hypothetical protein